jgi:hypothetical protein
LEYGENNSGNSRLINAQKKNGAKWRWFIKWFEQLFNCNAKIAFVGLRNICRFFAVAFVLKV